MDEFWFWFLMALFLLIIFAWPSWPHTRERWVYRRGGRWQYAPSGAAAGAVIVILLLVWLGMIVIWLPWAAHP